MKYLSFDLDPAFVSEQMEDLLRWKSSDLFNLNKTFIFKLFKTRDNAKILELQFSSVCFSFRSKVKEQKKKNNKKTSWVKKKLFSQIFQELTCRSISSKSDSSAESSLTTSGSATTSLQSTDSQ